MKQTRLLEIIREEIAGALREETNVTATNAKGETDVFPYNTPADKLEIARLKKDSNIKSIKTTGGQKIKEGEKRKKLAEKYQLDEETINEMASINQTVKGLKALGDEKKAELVLNVAQKTLNQFKEDPVIKSDRLFKNLKSDEYPNKKERTISYSTEFLKNFKKETGEDFNELTFNIEARYNKEKPGEEKPFKSPGLAINTTDKDAANQVLGIEKRTPGPQADPNKPKKEKLASTGKKGRPASEPKTEKSATLTKGDDGFDTVEYSDDEGSAEAAKAAGSDETAKKLGKVAYSKNLTPEEEIQYKTALKSINAKVKRIEDGEEKPDDRALLKKTYQNSEIQRLFKAKGSNLNDILKGIIG